MQRRNTKRYGGGGQIRPHALSHTAINANALCAFYFAFFPLDLVSAVALSFVQQEAEAFESVFFSEQQAFVSADFDGQAVQPAQAAAFVDTSAFFDVSAFLVVFSTLVVEALSFRLSPEAQTEFTEINKLTNKAVIKIFFINV